MSPPKPFSRVVLQAILDLWRWAMSYATAQVWGTQCAYVIGQNEMSFDSFAAVGDDGQLTGILPWDKVGVAYLFVFLFSAGICVIYAVLLVIQFGIHQEAWKENGRPPPTGHVILYVRMIDAAGDGISFVASNLAWVALYSTAARESHPDGKNILVVLFLALFFRLACTGLVESERGMKALVQRFCRGDDRKRAKLERIVLATHDQFIGQYAWLMGYAWYLVIVMSLTAPYFDGFHLLGVRWTVSAALFVLLACLVVLRSAKGNGLSSRSADQALHSSKTQQRVTLLHAKAYRWY